MKPKPPKPIEMSKLSFCKQHIPQEEPITPGSTFSLSPEELRLCINKGNAGDTESAVKVFNYYSFSNFDREKQVHWMKKAAEFGDANSQFSYAIYLNSEKKISEAIKWARKAASQENPEAQDFLDYLQDSLK